MLRYAKLVTANSVWVPLDKRSVVLRIIQIFHHICNDVIWSRYDIDDSVSIEAKPPPTD